MCSGVFRISKKGGKFSLAAVLTLRRSGVNSRIQVLGGGNTYLGGKFDAFFNVFLNFGYFFLEGGIWDSGGGGEFPPEDSWK